MDPVRHAEVALDEWLVHWESPGAGVLLIGGGKGFVSEEFSRKHEERIRDAPPLEEPSVDVLRKVLRTFPRNTGLGVDQLQPSALLELGDDGIKALIRIICEIERLRAWPTITRLIIVVLLAKAAGGALPRMGAATKKGHSAMGGRQQPSRSVWVQGKVG